MQFPGTLKQAFRALMRRPAMPTVVVAMLGLGIASVTVMFALFDAVLLRGLPYHEPERLVHIWGRPADPSLGGSPDSKWWTSYPDLEDYRDAQSHFEGLAGYIDNLFVVRTEGTRPQRMKGARVGAEFFELLGAAAERGRVFTPEEDTWGAEPVVVLAAGFASELGIKSEEIGRAVIRLNEVGHRVIGIMPASFDMPRAAGLWVPVAQNKGMNNRGQHDMLVLGRLKSAASLAEAEGELAAIAEGLAGKYPETNRNRSVWAEPLRESMVGGYRNVMFLLLAACGLLLLVVAVNVAGLLMVRALSRRRETAILRALGATRGRLARQLLAESLFMGLAGAGLGLVLAWAALASAPSWLPADLPFASRAGLNLTVFIFSLTAGLVTAVGFGLMPAWRGSRVSSAADLKGGASRPGVAATSSRAGGGLLVAQVGLAFALVAGATLLTRTAYDLLTEPLGFEAEGRVAFRIFLPADTYDPIEEPRRVNAYYRALLERVRAVPGVRSASFGSVHPLEPHWSTSYWIEGREPPASGVLPEARFRPVGPGYFETTGIPLISGRGIGEQDGFEAPGVVVINQAFARQHFGDSDPVGQYLTKSTWWEERRAREDAQRWHVVGVVGDVRFDGPGASAAPALYFSHEQWPLEDRFLLVETQGDAGAVVRPIQEVIWSIDDSVPADAVAFLDRARADLLRDRLTATALMAGFAGVVLVLAVAGLYALLAFAVTAERHYIGIRLAVGATPAAVLHGYLRRGLMLVTTGVLAGAVVFLAMRALIDALTEMLGPISPTALAASGAIFFAAALMGALVPARRAARLAPMEVLRDE